MSKPMTPAAVTMPGPALSRSATRLDSLTGLRFVAALAVFGVHAGGQLWPDNAAVARATMQGVSGVSFFFVLSGFVLAWSFRPELPARDFYRRRAARILPLYYLAIVAAVAVHVRAGGRAFLENASPSLGLLQSWLPRQPVYFGGNGAGWSLSCEAFFYALLPLIAVMLLKRRSSALWWLVGGCLLASVAVSLLLHPASTDSTAYWALYVLPPIRLIEFVAGVGLGLAMRRGWRSPLPLPTVAVLAAALYVTMGWAPHYLLPSALMFLPYLLIISSAATSDLQARPSLMRRRWFVRLGEWSFAFYLFHQTVITFLAGHMSLFPAGATGRVAATLLAFVSALAVSGVLYVFFEMPLERRLRPRPRVSAVLDPPAKVPVVVESAVLAPAVSSGG